MTIRVAAVDTVVTVAVMLKERRAAQQAAFGEVATTVTAAVTVKERRAA